METNHGHFSVTALFFRRPVAVRGGGEARGTAGTRGTRRCAGRVPLSSEMVEHCPASAIGTVWGRVDRLDFISLSECPLREAPFLLK